jgi:hypothetical protein
VPDRPAERNPINDAFDTVKAYAIQETVGPLKSVGRFLGFGLAGAFLLGLGVLLLTLGVLRLLQTETGDALDGTWSFVPYLGALLVAGLATALAVNRVKSTQLQRKETS